MFLFNYTTYFGFYKDTSVKTFDYREVLSHYLKTCANDPIKIEELESFLHRICKNYLEYYYSFL